MAKWPIDVTNELACYILQVALFNSDGSPEVATSLTRRNLMNIWIVSETLLLLGMK